MLKLIKQYAMNTYRGVDKDPDFFELGTSWRGVVSFTPRSLYLQGKSSPLPIG
jgi:hypothetical protein